jgi:anti-sigma-K factor RskA
MKNNLDVKPRGMDIPKVKVPKELEPVEDSNKPTLDLDIGFWWELKLGFKSFFNAFRETVKAVNNISSMWKWIVAVLILVIILVVIL